VPQQFVNFGDVFPHFVHLNMSATPSHQPWLVGAKHRRSAWSVGAGSEPSGIERNSAGPSPPVPPSLTRPCHLEPIGDGSHRK